MSELDQLKKKVVDTKAAYTVAHDAYRDAALAAYVDYAIAYATYVDAGAAYVKAINELKEYKEQDNE